VIPENTNTKYIGSRAGISTSSGRSGSAAEREGGRPMTSVSGADTDTTGKNPLSINLPTYDTSQIFCDSYQTSYHSFIQASYQSISYTIQMASIIKDSVNAIAKHYRKGDLNWPMIIYITLAHIAGTFAYTYMCHK